MVKILIILEGVIIIISFIVIIVALIMSMQIKKPVIIKKEHIYDDKSKVFESLQKELNELNRKLITRQAF